VADLNECRDIARARLSDIAAAAAANLHTGRDVPGTILRNDCSMIVAELAHSGGIDESILKGLGIIVSTILTDPRQEPVAILSPYRSIRRTILIDAEYIGSADLCAASRVAPTELLNLQTVRHCRRGSDRYKGGHSTAYEELRQHLFLLDW
jgi:hypothetical protein